MGALGRRDDRRLQLDGDRGQPVVPLDRVSRGEREGILDGAVAEVADSHSDPSRGHLESIAAAIVRNPHERASDDPHGAAERLPQRVAHGPGEDGGALRGDGGHGCAHAEREQQQPPHGGHGGK